MTFALASPSPRRSSRSTSCCRRDRAPRSSRSVPVGGPVEVVHVQVGWRGVAHIPDARSSTAMRWLWILASITPAARERPSAAAASGLLYIYTAIRRPSCDQRGRAAYPFKWVSCFGFDPSALSVQSCCWSFSPASRKTAASLLESGDRAGSKESTLSPVVPASTTVAGASPNVLANTRMLLLCWQPWTAPTPTVVPSGEREDVRRRERFFRAVQSAARF